MVGVICRMVLHTTTWAIHSTVL